MDYIPEAGVFTSDYLLYTKGDKIEAPREILYYSFYQIDNKEETNKEPTDANVFVLNSKLNNSFSFNPINEYLFSNELVENKYVVLGFNKRKIVVVRDKDKGKHIPKEILLTDFNNYNIYKVNVEYNRGSFLSKVPAVGTHINTAFNYIPFSGLATDALNVTQGAVTGAVAGTQTAVTGAVRPLYGRGMKKRKTKKNKNKKNKKQRKTRK